ncbi:MAG: hypothetical protein Tsb0021_02450 [Chlamydiales bacterium]
MEEQSTDELPNEITTLKDYISSERNFTIKDMELFQALNSLQKKRPKPRKTQKLSTIIQTLDFSIQRTEKLSETIKTLLECCQELEEKI